MSKNTETTPETPEVPGYETAFIVMKMSDGTWQATGEIDKPFSVERVVTMHDIRTACADLVHALDQQSLASLIASALAPQPVVSNQEGTTN